MKSMDINFSLFLKLDNVYKKNRIASFPINIVANSTHNTLYGICSFGGVNIEKNTFVGSLSHLSVPRTTT